MATTRKNRDLEQIGKCSMDSIRFLVAALECDYDRLDELSEQRADSDHDEGLIAWASNFPDEAKELAELESAASANGNVCTNREEAEQQIHEDALSLEVRSGWTAPGEKMTAAEYCILLTTGGPAVRIVGDLDSGEPTSARLEVQDWGTPWTEHITTGDDHEAMLTYARCFYFGE